MKSIVIETLDYVATGHHRVVRYPLAGASVSFSCRMPEASKGLTLMARVRYHILTDGQHELWKDKYRLTADEPNPTLLR